MVYIFDILLPHLPATLSNKYLTEILHAHRVIYFLAFSTYGRPEFPYKVKHSSNVPEIL